MNAESFMCASFLCARNNNNNDDDDDDDNDTAVTQKQTIFFSLSCKNTNMIAYSFELNGSICAVTYSRAFIRFSLILT